MPVDPTDPEIVEELLDAERDTDVEAPDADAAEQRAEVLPRQDEPLTGQEGDRANPVDVAEQARVVDLDDEDYR